VSFVEKGQQDWTKQMIRKKKIETIGQLTGPKNTEPKKGYLKNGQHKDGHLAGKFGKTDSFQESLYPRFRKAGLYKKNLTNKNCTSMLAPMSTKEDLGINITSPRSVSREIGKRNPIKDLGHLESMIK
jgi:hypothetical protein